jgi:GcrA cell cycle regulator
MPFDWTEERIENLKSLFADRLSAAQIAEKLPGDLTRNAVGAKLRRLGLIREPGQHLSSRNKRVRVAKDDRVGMPVGSLASGVVQRLRAKIAGDEAVNIPLKVVHDADDIRPKHIGLFDLTKNTCRWPYGEGPVFTFCGCTPIKGSPYCFHHDERSKPPSLQRPSKMGRVA